MRVQFWGREKVNKKKNNNNYINLLGIFAWLKGVKSNKFFKKVK